MIVHYNRSSNKKPLKRKLSISDEEEKDQEFCQFSSQKYSKKICLLNKFKEVEENYSQIHLEDLPIELHKIILNYLPVSQLLKTIQLLSKYWRGILLETNFWTLVNLNQPLNITQRLRKVQLFAERRSKGKQFKAFNRVTGEE